MSERQLSKAIAETKLPSGAWLVVGLLCLVGCLNYLDRIMITTMREPIKASIAMTDAQFGLLTSVFLWVYGILSPFAGYLADKFNRSRVIIGSLFVWSLVTWLTAHVVTFEQLITTRALMGISEACYIPAALALILDYHRAETQSLATGIHMAGIMVGQSLGFAGGWIAEFYDWMSAFTAFGVIGMILSLVLIVFLKDAPSRRIVSETVLKNEKMDFARGIKDLFSRRSYLLLLGFWGLFGIVGWMIMGWLPTYYGSQFNLSQGLAGLYATGYLYPASLAGVLLGGWLADRWSKINPNARILVPAIGLCIAAPAIFIASSTDTLAISILCFMIYGLTRTFSDANLMPILSRIANPTYRATGYGVLNLFSCIIGGIGLYAGGALRDANVNLSIVFKTAALILLCCAALLYMVRTNPRQDDATRNY